MVDGRVGECTTKYAVRSSAPAGYAHHAYVDADGRSHPLLDLDANAIENTNFDANTDADENAEFDTRSDNNPAAVGHTIGTTK